MKPRRGLRSVEKRIKETSCAVGTLLIRYQANKSSLNLFPKFRTYGAKILKNRFFYRRIAPNGAKYHFLISSTQRV